MLCDLIWAVGNLYCFKVFLAVNRQNPPDVVGYSLGRRPPQGNDRSLCQQTPVRWSSGHNLLILYDIIKVDQTGTTVLQSVTGG